MALIGSAPALRCPCGGTLLVSKDVQPLQSVKPIRIATADGESSSSTVVFSKQLSYLGYKIWFAKTFSKMNPCMSK
jgi:hypothetical protein